MSDHSYYERCPECGRIPIGTYWPCVVCRDHRAAKDAVNDHSGFNKAVRAIVDKVLEEREASTHVVEPEPLPHCPRCHKQREWAEPCAECGWEPWRWETKRDATT